MTSKTLLVGCTALFCILISSNVSFADEISNPSETEIIDNPFADTQATRAVDDSDAKPNAEDTYYSLTDSNQSVLNRTRKFSNSYQFDFNSGLTPEELVSNKKYLLFRISYYTNEKYSFGLGAKTRYGGRTANSEQLLQTAQQLDFDRASGAKNSQFVTVGYNIFYGKISLTKNTTMNTFTKIVTDFGLQSYSQTNRPFIQSSMEQSFFLMHNVALGFGIGLGAAEIVDPTSVNISMLQPVPSESSFSTKVQFNYFYSLNINIVL